MPVIAVVNRKGGCGKSTLATHLAAHCALSGYPVMLGDTDRNQPTLSWLRLRSARLLQPQAPIAGRMVDPRNLLRMPAGTEHVVLDTPGGLHGFELGRVVCHADALIIPVCSSVFDREAAAECWAELKTLPRITSGRCKVAVVGMRLDPRTKSVEAIKEWAAQQGLPFIGVLRQTSSYVRTVEHGLTVFDLPPDHVATDLAQWAPITQWLRPVLQPQDKPAAPLGTLRPSYKPNLSLHGRAPGITIPGALATDRAISRVAGAAPGPRRAAVLQAQAPGSWSNRLGLALALPLKRFLVGKP